MSIMDTLDNSFSNIVQSAGDASSVAVANMINGGPTQVAPNVAAAAAAKQSNTMLIVALVALVAAYFLIRK